MVVLAPGAAVELGTPVAEVAPTRPASPVEAIVVTSEDEAEAGTAAPRAASPIVSNLLRTITDTPEVASSSGVGHAKEASSLVSPERIVGESLLGDEIIIEPRLSGGSGDLVRAAPDSSVWGGPTLAWTSTKGDPYFVLDDHEEREF